MTHNCHCYVDEDKEGNTKLSILPHDYEEFSAIIERHGAWKRDIAALLRAAEEHAQATLDLEPESSVSESNGARPGDITSVTLTGRNSGEITSVTLTGRNSGEIMRKMRQAAHAASERKS